MLVPLKLLLVEDSEEDAELIVHTLQRGGFDVTYHRVETETEVIRALDEPWDVIISDFAMPVFDGLRAFETVMRRGLDVPFIFVSGVLGEERAVQAMRAGAKDYLLKGNLSRLPVAVARELQEAASRRARLVAEAALLVEARPFPKHLSVGGCGPHRAGRFRSPGAGRPA